MLQYILGNIRVLHSLQCLIFIFILFFILGKYFLRSLSENCRSRSVDFIFTFCWMEMNFTKMYIWSIFLDAIAVTPVSEWVSQSVSQWLIVSDLEIANASLSFATYNRNGTVFQKNSLHFLLEYLYQVYKWWLSSELFKFLDCFWEKVLHLGSFEIHKICILDAGTGGK